MQDSGSITATKNLADILDNLGNASIDELEVALDAASIFKNTFYGTMMKSPYNVWDNIIRQIESEILERTLLK